MQKSQLIKIPFERKIPQTDGVYMDALVLEDILRAVVYVRGYAWYVIFCDKENNDFITYNVITERWSNAFIYNLERIGFLEEIKYTSEAAAEIGDEYFGTELPVRYNATALLIMQFQDVSRPHERRYVLSDRQVKYLIEKDAGEFPEKEFESYLRDEVFLKRRYGFYEPVNKEKIRITCTHCGSTNEIKRPEKGNLQGKNAKCPGCGSEVILKLKNRMTHYSMADRGYVAYSERLAGVIRTTVFGVKQEVVECGELLKKPKYGRWKYAYYITSIDGHSCAGFEHHHVTSSQLGEKMKVSYPSISWVTCTSVYHKNLRDVLCGTRYQYGMLWELSKIGPMYIKDYFGDGYADVIEKLLKVGMNTAAYELLERSWSTTGRFVENKCGKTLCECIGVNKNELKFLMSFDASSEEITACKGMWKRGRRPTMQIMDNLRKIRKKDLSIYNNVSGGCGNGFYRRISGLSFERVIEYLAQKEITATLYFDYTEACKKLGYNLEDTKVAFPYNFMERHDSVIAGVEYEDNKDKIEDITKQYYKNIYDYYYEDGDLFVTVPKNLRDFVNESDVLHHCLSRLYVDKYAEGKTVIAFVRRKKEPFRPFYTAELRGAREIQLHGIHNCAASDDVRKFFDKYKKHLKKKGLTA